MSSTGVVLHLTGMLPPRIYNRNPVGTFPRIVIEFRSRLRTPIGEVDGSDEDSPNGRFNVTSLMVFFRISRQACAGQHGNVVSRENGHTVPGALPCRTASYPRLRRATGKAS